MFNFSNWFGISVWLNGDKERNEGTLIDTFHSDEFAMRIIFRRRSFFLSSILLYVRAWSRFQTVEFKFCDSSLILTTWMPLLISNLIFSLCIRSKCRLICIFCLALYTQNGQLKSKGGNGYWISLGDPCITCETFKRLKVQKIASGLPYLNWGSFPHSHFWWFRNDDFNL